MGASAASLGAADTGSASPSPPTPAPSLEGRGECRALDVPTPLAWPDLFARPRPAGGERFAYGPDPLQCAELWRPAGVPRGTIVSVHGGCWQTDIADLTIMDWVCADLAARGWAVWNVEYRGIDRPGGGWPGTFLDVAAAADALRGRPVAGDRVVALGHSAGGHLALWLAARGSLRRDSVLWRPEPLPIHAVLCLGGLPDLELVSRPPHDSCDNDPVPRLVGDRPDRFAETSPAELLPFPAAQVLVNATEDRIAPPVLARLWESRAAASGCAAQLVTVPDEGHVELIAPGSAAWATTLDALEEIA